VWVGDLRERDWRREGQVDAGLLMNSVPSASNGGEVKARVTWGCSYEQCAKPARPFDGEVKAQQGTANTPAALTESLNVTGYLRGRFLSTVKAVLFISSV